MLNNPPEAFPPSKIPSEEIRKHDDLLYSIVTDICGDDAIVVVAYLDADEEITDEIIREKAELKINTVRRILYKLYENHLATYRRVRDKETGWFIYYWKLDLTHITNLIRNKRELVLKKLKERLDYEKNQVFYRCAGDDCPRYTFEEAMELSFQCAVCQQPLIHYNNQSIIEALETKIKYLSLKM